MTVNQIIPMELKERVCIHCDRDDRGDPMTYLIAGKGQGKTTETIRQAVFRRDTILSTEPAFYRSAGMKHARDAHKGEVSYLSLKDVMFSNEKIFTDGDGTLNICVDNAREILEELLTDRFGVQVRIDFMSLEA